VSISGRVQEPRPRRFTQAHTSGRSRAP